jgi:hypothetical protein
MPSNLDVPHEMTTVVSFRVPIWVVDIMKEAAKKRLCSISDIGREYVLQEMRNRKLLTD